MTPPDRFKTDEDLELRKFDGQWAVFGSDRGGLSPEVSIAISREHWLILGRPLNLVAHLQVDVVDDEDA